jgi:hypothetical protein
MAIEGDPCAKRGKKSGRKHGMGISIRKAKDPSCRILQLRRYKERHDHRLVSLEEVREHVPDLGARRKESPAGINNSFIPLQPML